MSTFDDLVDWLAEFKKHPRPVSYIVLDPIHMGPAKDDQDGLGRRYVQCSPGVLNDVKFVKFEPTDHGIAATYSEGRPAGDVSAITGIPVYRLEDMRPDWPGLGVDHAPEVPT